MLKADTVIAGGIQSVTYLIVTFTFVGKLFPFGIKGILCDFFILTLEQIIALQLYSQNITCQNTPEPV